MMFCILSLLVTPVKALEVTAPEPPDSVQELIPARDETFGDGLWKILQGALDDLMPVVRRTVVTFASIMAVMLLTTLLRSIPGHTGNVLELSATLASGLILVRGSRSLIQIASETVSQLSEYGKLLLPVLTGALAAQGGATTATALYAGTAAFDAVLVELVNKLLIPGVSMFLVLALASAATGENSLKRIKGFMKWLTVWLLRGIIYLFTGYMAITGAVSGAADAAAIKATKLTISSMVPLVGGILSDASEALVVGAGVMKGAAGVYGLLVFFALWIVPFLRIGIQYLMLKCVGALCTGFELKRPAALIDDFSTAFGILLGMTGTVLILLLVSTVCFMKAVT